MKENNDCQEKQVEIAAGRTAESLLKNLAADLDSDNKQTASWSVSHRAEGRVLFRDYQARIPIADFGWIYRVVPKIEKDARERYCSDNSWLFRAAKTMQTHTFYSVEGERLTSFSIGPADCPRKTRW
jgi:hypothetical protein